MNIDLHCHTRYSDGAVSPVELVSLAKLRCLDVAAITDHDTMDGVPAAVEAGRRLGVRIVPGVEISASDRLRGRRVHILCYFPRKPDRLEGMLRDILKARRAAMERSIQKVREIYPVPEEMIYANVNGSASIYKQHVMRALMDAGYTDQMFGEVFRRLFHPREGLAYVPIDYPDVMEVLKTVRDAEGLAVLAHPSEYDSMDLLEELASRGLLQGAEVNHPRNKPEDQKVIWELCAQYGMAATGGTDFHGCNTRICNPLGSFLTDEGQFVTLEKKKW